MPFIKGSTIEKVRKGSFEEKSMMIESMLQEKYGDWVNVMATFEDHVLVINKEGKSRKISFGIGESGNYEVIEDKPSRAMAIIEDDNIPAHVSKELKSIVENMMNGREVGRTQVRELVPFINKDDVLWMSDLMGQIEESVKPNEWSRMYDANLEKIKSKLVGNIKGIVEGIPKVRYSKLSENRLPEFENELLQSVKMLKEHIFGVVNSCKDFHFGDNELLGAVCESLKVESQVSVDLLGKAEKLMGKENLSQLALAHDRLADRARAMSLMSNYLGLKSEVDNKE